MRGTCRAYWSDRQKYGELESPCFSPRRNLLWGYTVSPEGARSSVDRAQLAELGVGGSNPLERATFFRLTAVEAGQLGFPVQPIEGGIGDGTPFISKERGDLFQIHPAHHLDLLDGGVAGEISGIEALGKDAHEALDAASDGGDDPGRSLGGAVGLDAVDQLFDFGAPFSKRRR